MSFLPEKAGITGFILTLLLLAVPGLCLSSAFIPTRATVKGVYSPVFDPEANKVIYIEREVTARDWGPGWEFFSPPAHVRISRDSYRVMEHDLVTGVTRTLRSLPDSPLAGMTHRHYRGRLYGLPRVMIRYERESRTLEYEVAVSIRSQPTATSYRIFRWWNNATGRIEEADGWRKEGGRMQGLNEDRLRGQVELLALPGPEGIPCAVVAWDHQTKETDLVAAGSEYEDHYPSGVPAGVLEKASRKERIEHLRALRSDYDRFYRSHLAAGMNDGEARLAANRDMQDAGYFPRDPTLTARLVEPGEPESKLPVFTISRTEMESGIFNDIAGAIASPGTAVKNGGYSYITYRGYDTSNRLNAYLKTGALKYRVAYQGKLYELVIEKPPRE